MHPFRWLPAEGERHATAEVRLAGAYATGDQVASLCGLSVLAAEGTEIAWLWPTCPDCNTAAHRLAEGVQVGL